MKRTALFMIYSLLLGSWMFAQSDLQSVAIVRLTRSEPITVKQFRTEVESLEKQFGRAFTPGERREVLDAMINERLVLQAAERDRISVSDGELNQEIQAMRDTLRGNLGRNPTDAEFASAVRQQFGMEVAAFREQLRRQLTLQKYLLEKKRSILESIHEPTDAEVNSRYNLEKAKLSRPEMVRFSMIFVPTGADSAAKTRAKELADRLNRDIASNASKFDETMLRGQSPNSGYQAGDGGYLPRNMEAQQAVGQEFLNTAFALRQGEVSRLLEDPRGFRIIKITEKYDMKTPLDLDDIVQPGSRVTVRDYIKELLFQESQSAVLERATTELFADLRKGVPVPFQVFENYLTW